MSKIRVALLVALVACSSKKKEPTPYEQAAAKWQAFEPALVKLASDLEGVDCAQAAQLVDAFGTANAAKMAELEPLAAKLSAEEQRTFVNETTAKLMHLDRSFSTMAQKCPGDKALLAALKRAGFGR